MSDVTKCPGMMKSGSALRPSILRKVNSPGPSGSRRPATTARLDPLASPGQTLASVVGVTPAPVVSSKTLLSHLGIPVHSLSRFKVVCPRKRVPDAYLSRQVRNYGHHRNSPAAMIPRHGHVSSLADSDRSTEPPARQRDGQSLSAQKIVGTHMARMLTGHSTFGLRLGERVQLTTPSGPWMVGNDYSH